MSRLSDALGQTAPPQPPTPAGPLTFADTTTAYGRTALSSETAKISAAVNGTRNHTLNEAAFACYQLVAGGQIADDDVVNALLPAALDTGLDEAEARRTLASARRAGLAAPRYPAVRAVSSAAAATTTATTCAAPTAQGWAARFTTGATFVLDAPARPPAVWGRGDQVLWAQGEPFLLCGPAGVGKTSVAGQLVRGLIGLDGSFLGWPVASRRRVLYLAADRPAQIGRSLRRVLGPTDRDTLEARLIVWRGPPPADVAKNPDLLVEMAASVSADCLVVDSLKDIALGLSSDEVGAALNTAMQKVVAAGVDVLGLHHQRKANADNKRPTGLADVYGSTWITAGAGSVMLLWGQPGDAVVEAHHLKQPAEDVGPLRLLHDHQAGRTTLADNVDLVTLARAAEAHGGLSVAEAARALFPDQEINSNKIEKVRRRLDGLVRSHHLDKINPSALGGIGGTPAAVYLPATGLAAAS